MHTGLRIGASGAALVLAVVLPLRAAGAGFEIRPGILLDDTRGWIYTMEPQGGVSALDVTTGEPVWFSPAADRPLALLRDGRLAAQAEPERAGELPLVLLDSATGAARARIAVELPSGVTAAIDQTLTTTFETRVREAGTGLEVAWRHTLRHHKGMVSREIVEQQEARAAVDLTTLASQPAPAGSWPSPWLDALPRAVATVAASTWPASLQDRPAPVPHGALSPRWAGRTIIAPEPSPGAPGLTRVRRWDAAGHALADLELPSPFAAARQAAIDGRHLLMSAPSKADPAQWNWLLYSLETGRLSARLSLPLSSSFFFLRGATLTYLARPGGRREASGWVDDPYRLVGVDTASGLTRWTHAVRDTTYRGPGLPAR